MTGEQKLLALDVGCGTNKAAIKGYSVKTLDIRADVHPDIVAPIDKIPVPDESYDLLFASHVLEHVRRGDTHKVMKEWRRILKVGGKLQLVLPDLETAAIEILSCKTHSGTFDILWGAQNYEYNVHYSGYTWQMLEVVVKKFGYEINSIEVKDRQIFLTATKLDIAYAKNGAE